MFFGDELSRAPSQSGRATVQSNKFALSMSIILKI